MAQLPSGLVVPAARAYRNAAMNVDTTPPKIAFDTRSKDPGGYFDLTNGRFIVPVAGDYEVFTEIVLASSSGDMNVQLDKNGTLVSKSPDISNYGVMLADVITCAVGDYLEVFAFSSTSIALSVGSSTRNYLSVVKVA